MYSSAGSKFKKLCLQNKLKLLEASVRHLGTDINYVVLENLYAELKDKVAVSYTHLFHCFAASVRQARAAYLPGSGCLKYAEGDCTRWNIPWQYNQG